MNRNLRLSGLVLLLATFLACPAPVDDGFGFGRSIDTTPPAIFTGYPTTLVGSTQILVVAKINEAGKLYAIAVANGSTAPTNAQVKAGENYGTVTVVGKGSLTNVPANTEVLFTITGLSTNTNYDVYIVAEDNAGNLSVVYNQLNKTTQNSNDTTVPFLSTYSFTNTKTSITFTGTLNEDAYVWALLLADNATAPTVAQVKGSTTYSGFIARTQKLSTTSLSLQFTGLTEATDYDLYLIFTDAEGNETASPTKYDVQTQTPFVRIVSVAPVFGTPKPYWVDGNEGWIDIQILDVAAFNALSDWAVVFAYFNQARRVYMTKANLTSLGWSVANNDIIRIHGKNWTGTNDVNKTDNNASLWDYKTTNTADLLDTRYGYVYISTSSTIDGTEGVLDLMTYQNAQENQSHWVEDGTPANTKNLTFLQAQVPYHWNSNVRAGAVTLNDKLTQYLRLKTTVTGDGQSAADWETYSPPGISLSDASLSPNSILSGYSGTPAITISVKIQTFGGVALVTQTANASAISTGNNSVNLIGPDSNNIYTATVNLDNGKPVGSYNVIINATGTLSTSATLSIPFTVSPAGPILAFTGADFENGIAGTGGTGITPATANADPSPSGGDYLVLSGNTTSSNGDIYVSTANMGSATGYSKITFWLKGTSAKGLVVRIGTTGSDYYNVNSDNITDSTQNPLTVTASPAYLGKTLNLTNWVKVTLNLGSVDPSGKKFVFRGGGSANYNLQIDHIQFE